MPRFDTPHQTHARKILYLGDTGAGKTGSLCSLAAYGYNVRVLDQDNGAEVIRHFLTHPKSPYTKAHPSGLWSAELASTILNRMSYVTVTEGHSIQGTKVIPRGDSWHKIHQLLNDWRDGPTRLGNISTWTSNDILVIDGLSRFCESAMNYQLAINNHLLTGPQVGNRGDNDYSGAYRLVQETLDLLKADEIKCHIIMICHIAFLEDSAPQTGPLRRRRGFPQTIGPKLSPMIGQYFNHSIRAKSFGDYPNVRRIIVTNNDDSVELKNVAPLAVPQEYPLETGLAEYFRDIGAKPQVEESKTEPLLPLNNSVTQLTSLRN